MTQQEYSLPAHALGAALRLRLGRRPALIWVAGEAGPRFGPGCTGQITVGDVELEEGAQLRCVDGGRIRVGDGTYVGRGVLIHAEREVLIGSQVKIAWDVIIADTLGWGRPGDGSSARPLHIGDGAWIGAGAIVLGGADIGPGAVVGAGAVVRGTVAPGAVIPGRDLPAAS